MIKASDLQHARTVAGARDEPHQRTTTYPAPVASKRSSRRAFGGASTGEQVRVESSVGTLEIVPDRGRRSGRLLLIERPVARVRRPRDPEHLELDYVARIGAALEVVLPRGGEARVLHLGGGAFSLPRFIASTGRRRTRS